MRHPRRLPSPIMRLGTLAFAVIGLVLLIAAPALAHVDLESSSPADGTSVSITPDVIELRFTTDAVPAGDGIILADAEGGPVDVTVTQPEPNLILLTPTDAIPNGVYGVLWTVRAGDAHPRSGTFTFQVDAPVAEAPAGTPPDAESVADPSALDGDVVDLGGLTGQSGDPTEAAAVTDVELDPVFETPNDGSAAGEWVARLGRWVAMTGALAGIGAFAFAATSLIGTRREVEEAGYWVRRAGILVIVGTVVELVGTSMVLAAGTGGLTPAGLIDAVSGSFGIAVLLRVLGGAAMVRGMAIVAVEATTPVADAVRLPTVPGGGVAIADPVADETHRLDVHHEGLALTGLALVAASYLFDGHTVTATPALLVRAASATHVLAAGVWVGGVLLMAWTLAGRHRRGAELDASAMVIRFSRVASMALVVVALAGSILAIAILDTPTELLSTAWGRILIVKLIAVGMAGAIGAYNHFVTVPSLESDPADPEASERLRSLVRIEGAILLVVVVVTAVLVGAAS